MPVTGGRSIRLISAGVLAVDGHVVAVEPVHVDIHPLGGVGHRDGIAVLGDHAATDGGPGLAVEGAGVDLQVLVVHGRHGPGVRLAGKARDEVPDRVVVVEPFGGPGAMVERVARFADAFDAVVQADISLRGGRVGTRATAAGR